MNLHIDLRVGLRTETLTTVVMLARDPRQLRRLQLASHALHLSPVHMYTVRTAFRVVKYSPGGSWQYVLPNGKSDGILITYRLDGSIEIGYRVNALKHGKCSWTRSNGTSFAKDTYVYGLLHGTSTISDAHGYTFIRYINRHGMRHGKFKIWHDHIQQGTPKYTPRSKDRYEHDRICFTGEKRWYASGRPQTVHSREDHCGHNTFTQWTETGIVTEHVSYLYNTLHGVYQMRYETDTPRVQANYVHGLLHGEYMTWYKSGQPKLRCNWFAGQLHGERVCWDPDGAITEHEIYDHDVAIIDKLAGWGRPPSWRAAHNRLTNG